jgi:PAS domain S-box-containing protein
MLAAVFVSSLTVARAQAEEATQQIQKQLAVTLKSIGDALITTDAKGRVTFMNSVAQSLTGWTEAEARGRSLGEVFEILDPNTRVAVDGVVARVIRNNAVIALDSSVLLITRDGSEVPIDEIATPLRDSSGGISGVVLVLRNAVHHMSEKSNEELLCRNLALLGSVDAPMYAVDRKGRCLFLTRAASIMLGYRSDEIVGKDFHEIIHSRNGSEPICNEETCEAFATMHGKVSLAPISETMWQRNGKAVSVELSMSPLLIGDEVVGSVVTIADLTEHYRAQEALLRLETIVDSLEEAVVLHNLDGIITDWNAGAEKIYGYSREEIIGRHISIIHSPGRKRELNELFERVARREKIDTFETVRIGKGGVRIDVSIIVTALTDPTGAVVGVSQIVRDISELRAREEAQALLKTDSSHSAGSQSVERPIRDRSGQREIDTSKSGRQHARAHSARVLDKKTSSPVFMVGRSPAMQKLFSTIQRIAATESSVLITGATGTGKELIARSIHEQSLRANGPFVDINCSAIPEALIEAELFGHQKGTFTGAHEHRAGLFEIAAGGTLFLDEIDALNLSAQSKLLRVIQERRVRRIGGRINIDVDVRIISATNSDLSLAVSDGRFRADLFYRLRVVPLHVPPLYQRDGDVQLLIEYFLERHGNKFGVPPRRFMPQAMGALLEHPWPGNVRELENAIEYALAMGTGEELGIEALPPELATGQTRQSPGDLKQVLEAYMTDSIPLAEIEKRYILSVLQQFGGNQVRAAAALGIDRSKLYRRLKQYGVRAVTFLQDEDQDGHQMRPSKSHATV